MNYLIPKNKYFEIGNDFTDYNMYILSLYGKKRRKT